jgi:pimeloyl-ACP methyl ester carboxylesterase
MKMRISDAKAKKEFANAGVVLKTEFIDINGFKLHFAKTGNDSLPTLLFIHGSPGSWDAFKVYMQDKDLLAKYRMVSIDRPGFGYSQFGEAKNLSEQSAIISPLLNYLENGRNINLIGHSLGGPLSVKLAADNPGVFSEVILLAASVDPAAEKPETWRSILLNTPLNYLVPGAFRPSNKEIWYLKKDLTPLARQFEAVNSEVWILHGDKDNLVPVENAQYAHKMLIHAKSVHMIILKGAPHFIPWKPWYEDVKAVLLNIEADQQRHIIAKHE